MSRAPKSLSYDAEDIQVLDGLEHVRLRPGMYIGSTGSAGLHHLLWEVIDNGVDEFMAGYGDRIDVTLIEDDRGAPGVVVRDNGRGLPIDPMTSGPHKGKSAAEVIVSVLNSGGKFADDGAYKTSGGLHGIGIKATNALSTAFDVEVRRGGKVWAQSFRLRGDQPAVPEGKLAVVGTCKAGDTGTQITFFPDLSIFVDDHGEHLTGFKASTIVERLENTSYVNPGLSLVFTDRRQGRDHTPQTFVSQRGIVDLVTKIGESRELVAPPISITGANEEAGMQVDVALAWSGSATETVVGFSNSITNSGGGKHVEGMLKATTRAVNRYARDRGVLKEKEDNPTGADVRSGIVACVSLRLPNPAYDSQAKTTLTTPTASGVVESIVYEALTKWLDENPSRAKRIADKVVAAMRDRRKSDEVRAADKALARKTGLRSAGMPDKLYDCRLTPGQAENVGGTELLIVEGDSAGGTAVSARNPETQAVLPLRGKVLNVETANALKVAKNDALASLITTLGCGRGVDCDVDKLRYSRIVVLTDADVDGAHITVLLLNFFWRQMPEIVSAGRVFIAQPPLYSTIVRNEKIYLRDDAAKDAFLAANANHKAPFGRMKGLGEMDSAELRNTTVDPTKRNLLQVGVEDVLRLDRLFARLLGSKASERRAWLAEGGALVADDAASNGVNETADATDASDAADSGDTNDPSDSED